jgi:hypothetical protein
MDGVLVLSILALGGVVVVIVAIMAEHEKVSEMAPDERERYLRDRRANQQSLQNTRLYGPLNAAMVCPHCHARGTIRTMAVKRKKGISGGKATAALMTGGLSMMAVGLSRKEELTRARCDNCGNAWDF